MQFELNILEQYVFVDIEYAFKHMISVNDWTEKTWAADDIDEHSPAQMFMFMLFWGGDLPAVRIR